MRLEQTRWTSVDVYRRPWMAPRAGFEVDHKFLSSQVARTSRELSTPCDTPRYKLLWQWKASAVVSESGLIQG
jgi:hypothetical protein